MVLRYLVRVKQDAMFLYGQDALSSCQVGSSFSMRLGTVLLNAHLLNQNTLSSRQVCPYLNTVLVNFHFSNGS